MLDWGSPVMDPVGIPERKRLFFRYLSRALLVSLATVSTAASQMVSLPGGEFIMGSSNGPPDESPPHKVTLSPFKIDAHEVTRAMYDSCVRRGRCSPAHYDDGACVMWTSSGIRKARIPMAARSPQFPVVCVSWYQARDYCAHKGGKLPTEAQWEYAALAGGDTRYAWGNAPPDPGKCACASQGRPSRAGRYAPNARGIYDMTGNVWEWTMDRYDRDNYRFSEKENPTGPPVGRYRAVRGGGWYSGPNQHRIRNRQWFVPEKGEISLGFRCVK